MTLLDRLAAYTAQLYAPTTRAGVARTPKRLSRKQVRADRNVTGWNGKHPHYPPGPGGLLWWRCYDCGREYGSVEGAMKHERVKSHIVLRVDWLADGYLETLTRLAREQDARMDDAG